MESELLASARRVLDGNPRGETAAALRRGVEAALLASVPQVLVPHAEERLLGLSADAADLGPRFAEQLALLARRRLPEDTKWLAASSFHFGYAAFWGALYALAYQRRPVSPWLGGALLSTVVWAAAFAQWGAAVRSGMERPPGRRSWRKELILATAPAVFGLGTALLYGRGPRRPAA